MKIIRQYNKELENFLEEVVEYTLNKYGQEWNLVNLQEIELRDIPEFDLKKDGTTYENGTKIMDTSRLYDMLPCLSVEKLENNSNFKIIVNTLYHEMGHITDWAQYPRIYAEAESMENKEVGLPTLFWFEYIAEKRSHAVKAIFKDVKLYAILAVTLLQLYYTKFIGGIATWTQNGNEEPGLRWDSTGENCLGFQPAFVAVKLKQQFLLNFNWILTAGIVIAVAWWFILKVKGRKKIQASCKICGIAGAFVAFLSFSCLYITASVARYNVAGDVLLYLIFFYCMALFAAELPESTFLKKKYAGMAVTAVFGVLLAGECVFTVDPVTRGLFLKLDTGNTTLCFTGKVSDINSIYYGDYLIYNTQYTYIDKAYDKVLADVDYHPDTTDIYIPDSNGSFICGNLPFYYLNWDEKTKKRVFYENENTQEMEFYNEVKYFSSKMVSEGKDKAVLIVNPYMINVHEEEHLAKLAPYYEIGERKEVKLLQGSIVYYELTRK